MPRLDNQRHERFAQALFEGETADAAYVKAGFKANRGNASRLKANENILARLSELQAAAAKASECTVASLLSELEDARSKAYSLDQLSAAVKATAEKAKISGLLTQKIEIGAPGDFEHCQTNAEITEAIIADYKTDRVYSEEDEAEFRACCLGWLDAMGKFWERGRYRWVVEGNSVADKVDRERRERQRQRRLTNGGGQKNRAP